MGLGSCPVALCSWNFDDGSAVHLSECTSLSSVAVVVAAKFTLFSEARSLSDCQYPDIESITRLSGVTTWSRSCRTELLGAFRRFRASLEAHRRYSSRDLGTELSSQPQ